MEKANDQIIALIPARAGSKRVKGKNYKTLRGHPLLAYTIWQAIDSGIFKRIYVSTESRQVAAIAEKYGAEVIKRPKELAKDSSPDHEWVNDALFQTRNVKYDAYAILRPTCPFRKPSSIQTAWSMLQANPSYDSIRAIRVSYDHPYKMWHYWKYDDYTGRISPYMPRIYGSTPAYDMPTQQFDIVWSQSAALQIHWVGHTDRRDISGPKIMGIMLGEYESHDINTEKDWFVAECIAKAGMACLPRIKESFWMRLYKILKW